jgi:hypothetical protein
MTSRCRLFQLNALLKQRTRRPVALMQRRHDLVAVESRTTPAQLTISDVSHASQRTARRCSTGPSYTCPERSEGSNPYLRRVRSGGGDNAATIEPHAVSTTGSVDANCGAASLSALSSALVGYAADSTPTIATAAPTSARTPLGFGVPVAI